MTEATPMILLDIDNVFCDFTKHFRQYMADTYPEEGYPVFSCAEQLSYMTTESVNPVHWQEFWATGGTEQFWLEMPALFDPVDLFAIRQLAEEYAISWVTERPPNRYVATSLWLESAGLPNPKQITITQDKARLYSEMAKQMLHPSGRGMPRVRAIIDDKPTLIERAGALGLPIVGRAWPYNEFARAKLNVLGVNSVAEFCEVVASGGPTYGRDYWL